jgi:hypothetical protein
MIGFIPNHNILIIRPHNVFTDGRQQRQPNHNTTTYSVYWRKKTTINPIIIRPHCMFTDRRQQRQPNHNILIIRPHIVFIDGRQRQPNHNILIIRPHNVFTDGRQQRQPNHNTTTYSVYWRKKTTISALKIWFNTQIPLMSYWQTWYFISRSKRTIKVTCLFIGKPEVNFADLSCIFSLREK